MRFSEPRFLPFPRSWAASLGFVLLSASSAHSQDPPWKSVGPLCSGVRAVAFSGDGSSRAWAATAAAFPALFVSENNGGRWEKVAAFPRVSRIEDIETDPTDERVLFVSARDVLKSENRGRSWKSVSKGLSGSTGDLQIDPENPRTMFVLAGGRLFKTSNGGRRWRLAAPARSVESFAIHPNDRRLLWLSGDQGVSRSIDGGRSWTSIEDFRLRGSLVAIDPSSTRAAYAVNGSNLFKTTNGRRFDYLGGLPGGRPRFLEVNADRPAELLLGTSASDNEDALWRSTNGGRSWRSLGLRGVEISAFARDPEKKKLLLIGGQSGMYRSKKGGRGAKPADSGLHGGRVFVLATLPPLAPTTQSPVTYAGSFLCGLYSRVSAGRSWRPVGPRTNYTEDPLVVSPADPAILYRGRRGSLTMSADGGETWTSVRYDQGGTETAGLAVSPADPARVYAAVPFAGLYVSRDGGQTLSLIDRSVLGLQQATGIAPHPTEPDTVWVSGPDGLVRTTDGGTSWQRVRDGFMTFPTIDPLRPDTVWLVDNTRSLTRTTDAGASWSEIPLGLATGTRLLAIVADGLNAGTVYVATSAGVLRSPDRGATWLPFGRGLPDLSSFSPPPTTHLVLDANGELFFSTLDGVYSIRTGEQSP